MIKNVFSKFRGVLIFKCICVFTLLLGFEVLTSKALSTFFNFREVVFISIDVSHVIVIMLVIKLWSLKLGVQLRSISIKEVSWLMVIGLLIMLSYPLFNIMSLISNVIEKRTSIVSPSIAYFSEVNFDFSKFYYVLRTLLIMPFLEEIFYRGIIQRQLSYNYPSWLAIAVSSLFFALGHMDYEQSIAVVSSGIIIGIIYNKTKNLLSAILLHSFVNLFALFSEVKNYSFIDIGLFGYQIILLVLFVVILHIFLRDVAKNSKIKRYKENLRNQIISTMGTILYKENVEVVKRVDTNNNTLFLEPLLFSYFNNKKEKAYSEELLEEILQGYFIQKQKLKIKYSFNSNGIAYIPKIGYFGKGDRNPYEPILEQGDFEVVKEIHPTQEKYFVEFYKGHILNQHPTHNSVWKEYHKELFQAITVIEKHLPEFYDQLAFANKKIYLHDNPKILNFTTIETLGMLYFYVIGKNNLVYFIEELIHQGSHNYLYYVVHDRKKYFKIDVDNIVMRDLTKQEWDYRTVYGAFHGLFTVTQRVACFDKLLVQNVFSGREKHELLGRLTDQFTRFRTGLELLDFDVVFTKKGIKFYKSLDSKCERILNKYKRFQNEFDLSNRDLDFRYKDFCEINSYQVFLEKDKKGQFNF